MIKKKNFDFKKLRKGSTSKGTKSDKSSSQSPHANSAVYFGCVNQGNMMKDYSSLKKRVKKKKYNTPKIWSNYILAKLI